MASLQRSAREWENNAQSNALWAVLTDNRKKAQSWDEGEFFATGREEVRIVMRRLQQLGLAQSAGGCFLDFGCGVGRVTRALMEYFADGTGIDVSQTMIDRAREYAAADPHQARYIVNAHGDLGMVISGSIDFVYSHIVLQHIPASCQRKFIGEFLRILKPGGVAAFQIPTANLEGAWSRRLRRAKKILHRVMPESAIVSVKRAFGKDASTAMVSMDMNICSEEAISAIVDRNRCVLLDAPFTNSTDKSHRGKIRFMDRNEARVEILKGMTDSPYLSQFFFIRK
ncbi:MAG: class I SAM-dependent methyltransferase [Alphaproteobacteria bacterium]|nr:class I SAM-dependent methyltransferase [Alphaproteobacteria bacterium]MDE2161717.1 class I SAM-dependent methyltransferase [Alphaproteobacteria bacterium]